MTKAQKQHFTELLEEVADGINYYDDFENDELLDLKQDTLEKIEILKGEREKSCFPYK